LKSAFSAPNNLRFFFFFSPVSSAASSSSSIGRLELEAPPVSLTFPLGFSFSLAGARGLALVDGISGSSSSSMMTVCLPFPLVLGFEAGLEIGGGLSSGGGRGLGRALVLTGITSSSSISKTSGSVALDFGGGEGDLGGGGRAFGRGFDRSDVEAGGFELDGFDLGWAFARD
jgi:hypothetical protein